jgi:hypothetical protein
MKKSPTVPLLTAFLTVLVLVLGIGSSSRADNPPCQNAPKESKTNGASWPPGNVNVVINTNDFPTPEQQEAIKNAYRAWENANPNSGVHFTFTETTQPPPAQHPLNTNYVQRHNSPTGAETHIGFTGTLTTEGNRTTSAVTNIDPSVTRLETITQLMLHEIGHTFGLGHCEGCPSGSSVMSPPDGLCNCPGVPCDSSVPKNNLHWGCPLLTGPTECDWKTAAQRAGYPIAPPEAPPDECTCYDLVGCIRCRTDNPCACAQFIMSPILVDVSGDGFNLSDLAGGVSFDLNGDGVPEHLSWTMANSDDAWLALDRNSDGVIGNGLELFGNFTSQPEPREGKERNGFLALAECDKPANGGNADGLISRNDAIFNSLRLWQDLNHNGISEAVELFNFDAVSLTVIELNYKESKKTDQFGNEFRYRSKVKDSNNAQMGRWAWDVFLVNSP